MKKISLFTILSITLLSFLFVTDFAFGEDAIFIDENGKVGIGTTTPQGKLQVNGSIFLHDADGDDDARWGIYGWNDMLQFSKRNSDWSWNSTPMSINSSGNVGIGTTDPVRRLTVEYSGCTSVSNHTSAVYIETCQNPDGSDLKPALEIENGGGLGYGLVSQASNNYFSGKVGIGTSSASTKLGIKHGSDVDGVLIQKTAVANTNLLILDNTVLTGTEGGDGYASATLYIKQGGKNPPLFIKDQTGDSQSFIINYLGNVGIGDTSPSYILDVVQGSATDPHADSWQVHSSRKFKGNIQEVSITLDFEIPTYTYQVKKKIEGKTTEELSDKQQFGIMAEDAPEIIKGDSGDDIDLYAFATYNYELIKELKKEIIELETQVAELQKQIGELK